MFLFRNTLLIVLLFAMPAVAQVKEENSLILVVKLNQTMLGEEVIAYTTVQPGVFLLPLGDLANRLGLAIVIKEGVAQGWFVQKNKTISVDTQSHKIYIEGMEKSYNVDETIAHQGDIFVSVRLLNEWLPLGLSVNINTLTLQVSPKQQLPIEAQRLREQQAKENRARFGVEDKHLPMLPMKFRLFDTPIISENLQLNLSNGNIGFQSNTFISSDCLYNSCSIFLSTNQNGIQDFRASLGKEVENNKWLTRYSVGDTLFTGVSNIAMPRVDTGALITNYKSNRQGQTDKHTFTGDLPNNWDVTLYLNDAVLAYQASRADGRYIFADIPLLFGLNVFRLTFNNNNGETRTEIYKYNIADTLTPVNTFEYQAVANNIGGQYERANLTLNYGLLKNLTVGTAVTDIVLSDRQRHQYGSVEARGFWGGLYFTGSGITDANGKGNLVGGMLSGRLGFLNVSASRYEGSNFQSEVFQKVYGSFINSRTNIRLDTTLPGKIPLSLGASLQQDKLDNGLSVLQVTGKVSVSYKKTFLTNTIFSNDGFTTGNVLVSKTLKGLRFLGQIDYSVKPFIANTITGMVERSYKGYTGNIGISHNVLDNSNHLLTGINKLYKGVNVGATFDISKTPSAQVSISTSIGRANKKLISSGIPISGGAAIKVTDATGLPIANIGFDGRQEVTDKDGLVYLPLSNQRSNISINPSTLQDISEYPETEGVSVTSRQGRIIDINMKVVQTGELSGYVTRNGIGVAGIEVNLNSEGKTIKVRSGYDGFYYASKLKPTRYLVTVETETREVVIDKQGTSIEMNFKLTTGEDNDKKGTDK